MLMKTNLHRITIRAEKEAVFHEVVVWGQASWWPKRSLMKFINLSGPIEKGTKYLQKVMLPCGPSWHVQITGLVSMSSIRRDFLDGMFQGFETVSVCEVKDGVEVCYNMNYEIQGRLNRILWRLIFEKLHDRNIEAVLNNLKEFLENKKI